MICYGIRHKGFKDKKGFTPIVLVVVIALFVLTITGNFLIKSYLQKNPGKDIKTNIQNPAGEPSIIFVYTNNGNIWLANQRDKVGVQITSGGQFKNPVFSPDGKYLEYLDKNKKLWLLKLTEKSSKLVFDKPVYQPVWSPDSGKISFSTAVFPRPSGPSNPTNNDLYIYDVKQDKVNEIFGPDEKGNLNGLLVSWSGDGQYLGYATTVNVGLVNPDMKNSVNTEFPQVSVPSEFGFSPNIQWAFDNKTLYFSLPDKPDILEKNWSLYSGRFGQKAAVVKPLNNPQQETLIFSPYNDKVLVVKTEVLNQFPDEINTTISVGDHTGENLKELLFFQKSGSFYSASWTDIPGKILVMQTSYQIGSVPESFLFDLSTGERLDLPYPPIDPHKIRTGAYLARNDDEWNGKQYYSSYYLIYNHFSKTDKLFSAIDWDPNNWFSGKVL